MCVVLRIVAYYRRRDLIGRRRHIWHSHAQSGLTALVYASGHADCVRLLLDAGADMNAKNNVRDSVDPVRVCLRASVICWWDGDE